MTTEPMPAPVSAPAPDATTEPVAEPPLTPPGARRRAVRLRRDVISYLEWPTRSAGKGATVLLLHGLQSTALTMARIGETLSGEGWHVIAPDLPGHGRSFALDGWDADRPGQLDVSRLAILRHRVSRRHRLRTTARVMAELASRLELSRPGVLGHSWGASVAAILPAVGLQPSALVLVDPPFVTADQARALGQRMMVAPTTSYEEARATLLSHRDDWHPLDLAAKAEAVTTVSVRTMVAVVAANVPFDPLPALRRVAGRPRSVPVYVIVGGLAEGSFVSPAGRDGLRALLGDDRVLVLEDAGHSPHRTHHGPFMVLVRQALGPPSG